MEIDETKMLADLADRMDNIEHRLDILTAHLTGTCRTDCPCHPAKYHPRSSTSPRFKGEGGVPSQRWKGELPLDS